MGIYNRQMIIAPLTLENLDDFLEIRNLSSHMLHDSRKFSINDAIGWYFTTTNRYFCIFVDDIFVGYIRTSNWDFENKSLYIGCDIHPNYRRRGIAYKAYNLFMNHIYCTLHIPLFKLEVLEKNSIALNLYNKLGFVEIQRYEGTIFMEYLMSGSYENMSFSEKVIL